MHFVVVAVVGGRDLVKLLGGTVGPGPIRPFPPGQEMGQWEGS